MSSKPSFWQRIGLHDWFLKNPEKETREQASLLTPEVIYNYILQQFRNSIEELSFAGRVVFYHEYIIVFNTEDYQEFMEHKKGLFGLIVQESVKKFSEILREYAQQGKTVIPSSSKWVFRFVSHPDYAPGDKGFIGKLLPGSTQKSENLRVTFIPRQTGMAETSDLSAETLATFTYYSEGYYEVPFELNAQGGGSYQSAPSSSSSLARFEVIVPDKAYAGKKIEYLMKDDEIVVTGTADQRQERHVFRIPSEWVDTPHLRIRYNRGEDKFYVASFGEKTIVNEKTIAASDPQYPSWVEIPLNSRIVLNGIIGVNMFKA